MNLTKNEERLLQWSRDNKEEMRKDGECHTFWKERDVSKDRVLPYAIETLKDMQEFLEKEDIEPSVALIFSAEAMKQKGQYFKLCEPGAGALRGNVSQIQSDIPDYVYMF